jgi:hypothetical protein
VRGGRAAEERGQISDLVRGVFLGRSLRVWLTLEGRDFAHLVSRKRHAHKKDLSTES